MQSASRRAGWLIAAMGIFVEREFASCHHTRNEVKVKLAKLSKPASGGAMAALRQKQQRSPGDDGLTLTRAPGSQSNRLASANRQDEHFQRIYREFGSGRALPPFPTPVRTSIFASIFRLRL